MFQDATNSFIKETHSAWVEDTIAFEQNHFLRRIAGGWDVIGAHLWFKNLQDADEESESGLWILAKALTEAVIFCHDDFPLTLILDRNRLRTLQIDFQVLIYQAACRRTLYRTLKFLGWEDEVLAISYTNRLFLRVNILISDRGLQYDYWQRRGSVALEVVGAAYAICGKDRDLPTFEDVQFAEDSLRHCCDPRKPVFGVMQRALAVKLIDKVDVELCESMDLTPVQLMGRLLPPERGFVVESEIAGLVHIAKRISHIAELHWRVWGPILYEQPLRARDRASRRPSHTNEHPDDQGSSPSHAINDLEELLSNTHLG